MTTFLVQPVDRVQKNCANLFSSEICQISTDFDNFWQKDGKEAKIMWGLLIFHFTYKDGKQAKIMWDVLIFHFT